MSSGIVKPSDILSKLSVEAQTSALSNKLQGIALPTGTPDAKLRVGYVTAFDPMTWTCSAMIGDQLTEIPSIQVLGHVQPMVDQAGLFVQAGGDKSTQYTMIGVLTQGSTGGASWRIRKPADQSVTNTATLQLDSDLKFYGQDQRAYLFHAVLFVHTNSAVTPNAADFALGWTLPTGASWSGGGCGPDTAVVGQVDSQETAGSQFRGFTGQPSTARLPFGLEPANVAGVYDNRISTITFSGSIKMGNAASGVCTLSWCQNVAAAASVKVREGSFLTVDATQGIYP